MKYFLAENANRKLLNEIVFEPIDIFGGTVRGVYKTKYDTVAKNLSEIPGVREISESEYEDLRKKKSPNLDNSLKLREPSPDSQARITELPAAVVSADTKKKPKLPSTAEALQVGKIGAAKP